jgi:acetylornithine deacetylase/succinyl-diaminopimelate desuccinylase-like protein
MLALALVSGAVACAAEARFAVDGERALRRVAYQVEAGPRIPGTAGHRRVREWIAAELGRLGAEVEIQTATDTTLGRRLELFNVLGRYAPARPGPRTRGPLVLCAHYDTRPWADQDPDSARRRQPVPGANDGGSGVAVLLEMAEILSRRPPPCPVELVFFDAEDQGRPGAPEEYSLGSRAYARRLPSPPPRAAVLFDMVGDRDLAIHPEQHSVERASSLVDLVLAAARATGARHFHDRPRYRLMDDHVPLLEAGVPAVDVIDFDYPAWHTLDDDLDQVSAGSLAEVARVAAWLVYRSPLARLP